MRSKISIPVVLLCVLALPGCKPKKEAAPAAATQAAVAPAAVTQAAVPAPAVTDGATPAAARIKFDINSVALSTAALPPFPYLDWPSGLDAANSGSVKKEEFDQVYVIAGDQLLAVEGRLENRHFMNSDAKLSDLAAQRNYEAAIKALGAVKVSTVSADDPALIAQNGGDGGDLRVNKMRAEISANHYDYYLIRKPEGNIWIGLLYGGDHTQIITLKEAPLKTSVSLIKADKAQK